MHGGHGVHQQQVGEVPMKPEKKEQQLEPQPVRQEQIMAPPGGQFPFPPIPHSHPSELLQAVMEGVPQFAFKRVVASCATHDILSELVFSNLLQYTPTLVSNLQTEHVCQLVAKQSTIVSLQCSRKNNKMK